MPSVICIFNPSVIFSLLFFFSPFFFLVAEKGNDNFTAGHDEFSLLPALCTLQYTALDPAGSTTAAASAGTELSKSENSL